MTIEEAKQLKVGDRIRWDTGKKPQEQFCDPGASGTVTKRVGAAVEIRWDDGKMVCVGTIEGDKWRDEWWGNVIRLTPLKEFMGLKIILWALLGIVLTPFVLLAIAMFIYALPVLILLLVVLSILSLPILLVVIILKLKT